MGVGGVRRASPSPGSAPPHQRCLSCSSSPGFLGGRILGLDSLDSLGPTPALDSLC